MALCLQVMTTIFNNDILAFVLLLISVVIWNDWKILKTGIKKICLMIFKLQTILTTVKSNSLMFRVFAVKSMFFGSFMLVFFIFM